MNKYKKDLGGESAYKKTTEEKKQQEEPKKKEKEVIVEDKNEEEKKNPPKPFGQQGRKLLKPGEAPAPVQPANTKPVQKPINNTTSVTNTQVSSGGGGGFNFFDDEPQKPVAPTVPAVQQTNTAVTNQINFTNVQQPQQQTNQSLPFGQFQFPQQPQQPVQTPQIPQQGINFYGQQSVPQNIPQVQPNTGFNFGVQAPINQINFGGYQPQPQQPQPQQNFNPTPQSNQGLLGFGPITMNPTPVTTNQGFTMNKNTTSKDDEFGGFDQGHREITWMSADESSLVGLDDLSK